MKNSMGLYFQLEIENKNQAFSLIRESLNKIEKLEEAGISVKYLELRAKELPDYHADKEIWLKIDSDKGTYTASKTSFEWDSAFNQTMKKVEERMLSEEADYTKHASLVEISLPLAEYYYSLHGNTNNGILI